MRQHDRGPARHLRVQRSQQLHQGAATHDDIAAFVDATVVGRPRRGASSIDAGSKVLTSDRLIVNDPDTSFGAVAGYPGACVSRSAKSMGVELPPNADLRIGDRVAIVPNHICPVINLADSVSVIVDGVSRSAGRWRLVAESK